MLFAVALLLAHHCKVTLLKDGVGSISSQKMFQMAF